MDSVLLSISQDTQMRWIMVQVHFWCWTIIHHGQFLHNEIIVHELDSIHIAGLRLWLLYILARLNIKILQVMVELSEQMRFSGWQQVLDSSIMNSWHWNSLEWVVSNMLHNFGSIFHENIRWLLRDIRHWLVIVFQRFLLLEAEWEWLLENSRIYDEQPRHILPLSSMISVLMQHDNSISLFLNDIRPWFSWQNEKLLSTVSS